MITKIQYTDSADRQAKIDAIATIYEGLSGKGSI